MHRLFAASILSISCISTLADVLPPRAVEVGMRMQKHPNLVDRIERLCTGRKAGDSCTIPGTAFSGGGAGTCSRHLNNELLTIDLICEVNASVIIDRKLPGDEVGWVHDANLCNRADEFPPGFLNCAPLSTPPVDAFCQGRAVGAACVAELRVTGQAGVHRFPGICSRYTERMGFYYQGHRTKTRDVIRCEAPALAPPHFDHVSWYMKLFQ